MSFIDVINNHGYLDKQVTNKLTFFSLRGVVCSILSLSFNLELYKVAVCLQFLSVIDY